jgi:streptogramin lyase
MLRMISLHKIGCFLSVCLFVSQTTVAQGIGIGEWRTHLPYQQVIDVEVVGDKTYAATPFDLFIYNHTDNSISFLNKVNGLNDIGISAIKYNSGLKTLLIAYSNTNIDLVTEDKIVNMSDIYDKDLIGNKSVNDVMFIENYAYVSCGFGIVVLDIERKEVFDTYLIGPQGSYINVYDVTLYNNKLYASTESGIYYADIDSPNLADYNEWTKDVSMLQPNISYRQIEAYAGKLFANYSRNSYNTDTLYVYDGTHWDYFDRTNNSRHTKLRVDFNKFILLNNYSVNVYDQNLQLLYSAYNLEGVGIEPKAATLDANDNLWIGDRQRGLFKTYNTGFSAEVILPNGPATTNVYEIKARGKYVWVASGGRASNWAKLYMVDGVFGYDGSTWRSFNRNNTTAFDSISDFVSVAIDPLAPNKAFIGTWQDGVIEFTDNELSTIYSVNNSSLQPWIAAHDLVNISGLDYDSYNNLWVANTGATDIVSMKTPEGQWRSFNLGASASGIDVANMIVDKSNYKWIIRRQEGMVMVFKDNNTFDNPADDKVEVLSSSPGSGNIPGNQVLSMAVDQDGAVWLGTDEGPAVFYDPNRIFEQGINFDAQQILIPRNDGTGQADYLLASEKILSIAVDGSNKKWFGTENGVFLISKDGLEEIYYFNTENSPLLSNTVSSIAINEDGEVFFGTGKGIVSFRGNATPPTPVNTNVYAFPNPVRENYVGPIAIKGLVSDAFVKITDISGSLVYETQSEGGQAIWDGLTANGKEVKPGIYLVFVSNNLGEETLVSKILMMR